MLNVWNINKGTGLLNSFINRPKNVQMHIMAAPKNNRYVVKNGVCGSLSNSNQLESTGNRLASEQTSFVHTQEDSFRPTSTESRFETQVLNNTPTLQVNELKESVIAECYRALVLIAVFQRIAEQNTTRSPSPTRESSSDESTTGSQRESDGNGESVGGSGSNGSSPKRNTTYSSKGNIMIGNNATINYIQPQANTGKMDRPGGTSSDKSMDDNVSLGQRASQGDLGGIVKAGQDITFGDNPEIRTKTPVEKKPLQMDCRACDDDKMGVADLLSELGLQNLEPKFQHHAIHTIEMCRTLTDQDMEDLGLIRIGDRKRFLALLKRLGGDRECVPSPCTPTVLNAGGSIIFGKEAKIITEVYVPASSTDGMEEYFDKGRNS